VGCSRVLDDGISYSLCDERSGIRFAFGCEFQRDIFLGNVANAVGFFFVSTVGLLAARGINLHVHMGFWMAISATTILWFLRYSQLRNAGVPKLVYGKIFRQNFWVGFVVLTGMIVGEIF
jgi:4-hydroxybenzoate polyprenyltransferase